MDAILEKKFSNLPAGRLLFNPPEEMRVHQPETVEVRLASNSRESLENLQKGLIGRGSPEIEQIEKVSPKMKVVLRADENEFVITPLPGGNEEQYVDPETFTEWAWRVVPVTSGSHKLYLGIDAIIELPNRTANRYIPVIEKEVKVRVDPVYASTQFLKAYWQWILGTLLIPLLVGLWKARQNRRDKKATWKPF